MTSNEKLLDERIREALNYVSKTQAHPIQFKLKE